MRHNHNQMNNQALALLLGTLVAATVVTLAIAYVFFECLDKIKKYYDNRKRKSRNN
jgi:hypothetical protein